MQTMEGLVHEHTTSGMPISFQHRFGNYSFIRVISKGLVSIVVEVVNTKSFEHFAVKITSKTMAAKFGLFEKIEAEMKILPTLQHNNIIHVNEVIEEGDLILLVIDLCISDLFEFIKKNMYLDIEMVKRMFIDIVSAVDYLHENGISHGDIKPENILITKNLEVKLCDFECSDAIQCFVGDNPILKRSILYISPEMLENKERDPKKSDVWALGVLLHLLATGALPWHGIDEDDIKQEILSGNIYYSTRMRPDLKELLEKCLCIDPDQRITTKEILQSHWLHPVPLQSHSCSFLPSKKNSRKIASRSIPPNGNTKIQPSKRMNMASLISTFV